MRNVILGLTAVGCLLYGTVAFAGDPALTCEASKLKAVSKYDSCRLKAYRRGVTRQATPDFSRCDLLRFADAEAAANGFCTTTGDQTDIGNFVDFCTDSVAIALAGGGLPMDCLACSEDLEACSDSLGGCEEDLAGCQGDLGTATSGTATVGQVLTGRTFTSSAGLGVSGTMPNNGAVSITPGTASQAIAAGYHNGSGACAGDADLVAGNIKSGVNLFGVNGLAVTATGSATAPQVLSGATFSNTSGSSTGTMPNNGAVSITPGTASQAVAAGYHNGSGSVAGDADLVAAKIVAGVNLFGVNGTAISATGSATAAQVLSGASFSNASGSSTGTMPNNGAVAMTPGIASQTITAGYHNGSGSVAGDSDLVAANVKSGVNLFGVTGTAASSAVLKTGQTTSYGTGSDGDTQKGVTRSFTDNGNGTITDNGTGLMWEKKSDDGSIHDKDNSYTWSASGNNLNGTVVTTFLATLNAGGGFASYTDWRLPTIYELETLRNLEVFSPATFSAFHSSCIAGCSVTTCSCTRSSYYLSSTTSRNTPSDVWIFRALYGDIIPDVKTSVTYVRAVRGV